VNRPAQAIYGFNASPGPLADVLLRVQTHPQSRIHELLPKAWSELYGQQKAEEDQ